MDLRRPVTLEGRFVRLVPLERSHAEALARAGSEAEIWRYLPYGPRTTPGRMAELIELFLAREARGTDLCFSVISRAEDALVGMTRFLNIERENGALEIGGTWYAASARRTPVNTEAKRLLLAHAFETEGVHRVQLKTDLRNERSQRAIERLGAVRDGILREHVLMPDGYRRSSVVYSILADEWPVVRSRLDRFLSASRQNSAPTVGETSGDASP